MESNFEESNGTNFEKFSLSENLCIDSRRLHLCNPLLISMTLTHFFISAKCLRQLPQMRDITIHPAEDSRGPRAKLETTSSRLLPLISCQLSAIDPSKSPSNKEKAKLVRAPAYQIAMWSKLPILVTPVITKIIDCKCVINLMSQL